MKKNTQRAQHILRQTGLLSAVEQLRYWRSLWRYRRSNRRFRRQYPDFAVPPLHIAYDTLAGASWEYYHRTGIQLAEYLAGIVRERGLPESAAILEWGCGPGRIIRHLPDILPGVRLYGSDYNAESIAWAQHNIPGVQFVTNGLQPPLPFEGAIFDFVYAFSVFTHLAEHTCLAWADELHRVLRPGGWLFLTTSGDMSAQYLLPHERRAYDAAGFWYRDKMTEGKKMAGMWMSPAYVRDTLLRRFAVYRHDEAGGLHRTQDRWLAQKAK